MSASIGGQKLVISGNSPSSSVSASVRPRRRLRDLRISTAFQNTASALVDAVSWDSGRMGVSDGGKGVRIGGAEVDVEADGEGRSGEGAGC